MKSNQGTDTATRAKRKSPTRLVAVRLPVDLADEIERAAAERGSKEPWDKTAEIIFRLRGGERQAVKAPQPVAPERVPFKSDMGTTMKRLHIWLPESVWQAAEAHANVFSVRRSRWIADCIQSIVMRPVVLAKVEILFIRSAIRELSAVGRNLNQITHQINSDAYQRGMIDLKHDAVMASINNIEPKVRMLMKACKSLVDARERSLEVENV